MEERLSGMYNYWTMMNMFEKSPKSLETESEHALKEWYKTDSDVFYYERKVRARKIVYMGKKIVVSTVGTQLIDFICPSRRYNDIIFSLSEGLLFDNGVNSEKIPELILYHLKTENKERYVNISTTSFLCFNNFDEALSFKLSNDGYQLYDITTIDRPSFIDKIVKFPSHYLD